MIKSMTGYGLSQRENGTVQLTTEVKSLNSKFLDIVLRLPRRFADKELEIRNIISDVLERGKVSLTADFQFPDTTRPTASYNESLFVAHYTELKKLADKVSAPLDGLFELALNAPDVLQNHTDEKASEEEWFLLKESILDALHQCDSFRVTEGKALQDKLMDYQQAIRKHLDSVESIDPVRIEAIRTRLKNGLKAFIQESDIDQNRLEQELIFYIEKLDIKEECVRLRTHLDYFKEVLLEKTSGGKKLGFISQEIGREINTIGSKANDANMQKLVVLMKEELEKIKEQLNNVL